MRWERRIFVQSCRPLSLNATARAVIGYCDGLTVRTFVGDTEGTLSEVPRGERHFYWDTIFCPKTFNGKTYAEIVGADGKGLAEKMSVSQSARAFMKFLEFRIGAEPALFS